MFGVWASSTTNVIAVGEEGIFLHYDGEHWRARFYFFPGPDMISIWGSSANDVWAVGESGIVFHFDGDEWDLIAAVLNSRVYGVWGAGNGTVFFCGSKDFLTRYK